MNAISILERLAENGTAPDEGCSSFGVGYEDAFERLRETYLLGAFDRGRSAQKFVIGPYGAGKTHFLRQLMEIAREEGCVTSEVALTKDVDYTRSIVVYKEIVAKLRTPKGDGAGMDHILRSIVRNVAAKAPTPKVEAAFVDGWVAGLRTKLLDATFAKVAALAFMSLRTNDANKFDRVVQWLSGEMFEKGVARDVGVAVCTQAESNRVAQRALLSLFQLIRHAGFQGTVVCFDEAEQGLTGRPARHLAKILSQMQSDINALADLQDGSALIAFGITPDVSENFEHFAALQQRLADAEPGVGFFDGATRSPKIDLTRRGDPVEELTHMGRRLVQLAYDGIAAMSEPQDVANARIEEIAVEVVRANPGTQNRRDMAKRAATYLLSLASLPTSRRAQSTEPEF